MPSSYDLDKTYLSCAEQFAKLSYCKRAQVGAIVVKDGKIITSAYNGTPSGDDNVCELEDGSTKHSVLHAEANAISKLAKDGGVGSNGSTLYCTHSPCQDCAKLIYQSGIKRVVYLNQYRLSTGIDFLIEHGVAVERFSAIE